MELYLVVFFRPVVGFLPEGAAGPPAAFDLRMEVFLMDCPMARAWDEPSAADSDGPTTTAPLGPAGKAVKVAVVESGCAGRASRATIALKATSDVGRDMVEKESDTTKEEGLTSKERPVLLLLDCGDDPAWTEAPNTLFRAPGEKCGSVLSCWALVSAIPMGTTLAASGAAAVGTGARNNPSRSRKNLSILPPWQF